MMAILAEETPEEDDPFSHAISGLHFLKRLAVLLLERNFPDHHSCLRGLNNLAISDIHGDMRNFFWGLRFRRKNQIGGSEARPLDRPRFHPLLMSIPGNFQQVLP